MQIYRIVGWNLLLNLLVFYYWTRQRIIRTWKRWSVPDTFHTFRLLRDVIFNYFQLVFNFPMYKVICVLLNKTLNFFLSVCLKAKIFDLNNNNKKKCVYLFDLCKIKYLVLLLIIINTVIYGNFVTFGVSVLD